MNLQSSRGFMSLIHEHTEIKAEKNNNEKYINCVSASAVSTMAAQEYDGMKEQLDLEQSLRVKAETYAHEVKT